jgi:hypothetical protein
MQLKLFATCLFLFSLSFSWGQSTTSPTGSPTIILQSRQYTLHSNALDRDMLVKVRFPDGYEKSDKKYPVLYLLDGDFFFAASTDIVQYLEWGSMIPEAIIVSPAYGCKHEVDEGCANFRRKDFALTPYGSVKEVNPERFYSFLKDELILFADKNFRTDTANRCLWGYSRGGEFGAYVLFHEGQPFHRFILLEGLYNTVPIMEKEYCKAHADLPVKLFIGYGVPSAGGIEFISNLKKRGYQNLLLFEEQLKNVEHFSIAGEGLTLGLKMVYKKQSPFELLMPYYMENGITATVNKYNYISRGAEKERYNWDRLELDRLGSRMIDLGKYQDALKIFKINAALYPTDPEVYSSLAWAYEKLENKKMAIHFYEEVLKLDSKQSDAIEGLQNLKK